jgi:hypothetical protein
MSDALVQRLADRAAIHDLVIGYFLAIDRRDWDAVRACFADDADLDYAVFRGDPAHAIACMQRGLTQFEQTMHFGGNVVAHVEGDAARAECYAVCYHRLQVEGVPHDRTSALHYRDALVRTAAGWRIAERRVRFVWERFERSSEPPPPRPPR